MKLFLGIFPPKEILDELRDTLRKYNKQKRNLKYIPIDQLHVTVKYIGSDVTDKSYEAIREQLLLHEGNYGKPNIKVKGIQFGFKHQFDPRVIMANVDGGDELVNLSAFAHQNVRDLKLRDTIRWKGRYSKDFHISLARLKNTATKKEGKFIKAITFDIKEKKIGEFQATEMYLVESISKVNREITYRKLEKINL